LVSDLLTAIARHVEPIDAVFRASLVNKHWNSTLDNPRFWRLLVEGREDLRLVRGHLGASRQGEPSWKRIAATSLIATLNMLHVLLPPLLVTVRSRPDHP